MLTGTELNLVSCVRVPTKSHIHFQSIFCPAQLITPAFLQLPFLCVFIDKPISVSEKQTTNNGNLMPESQTLPLSFWTS